MTKKLVKFLAFCLPLFFLSCEPDFRANYKTANSLLHQTKRLEEKPFLKAHLKNGDVYILNDQWKVDTLTSKVKGTGSRYDFNRRLLFKGEISVPIDSVAIFETNKLNPAVDGRIALLSVLTGIDLVITGICISNPKACFGSCPTFYVNESDNFHYADAEGFSNAILPSLEYGDVDALNNAKISDSIFSLTMKNEALETHCINEIKILSCPRKSGQRIYHDGKNNFYACEKKFCLTRAEAHEGDVTHLLSKADRKERFSISDESNLAAKEELILEFDTVSTVKQLGLALTFRQTLMTTHLIYSAMAYMGDEVSDIFSKIERNNKSFLKGGIKKQLGNIELWFWDHEKHKWIHEGSVNETGPIAFNRQVIPLKHASGTKVKLKVVMSKGFWRLDETMLTEIAGDVQVTEVKACSVQKSGINNEAALNLINSESGHLISLPGDKYKISFRLPTNTDQELFLYTKGYYLEWMRANWLGDKDLKRVKQMVVRPKKFLRTEAKRFKKYESRMEEQFWNSKISETLFIVNEN